MASQPGGSTSPSGRHGRGGVVKPGWLSVGRLDDGLDLHSEAER